jgi:hypothetical protein
LAKQAQQQSDGKGQNGQGVSAGVGRCWQRREAPSAASSWQQGQAEQEALAASGGVAPSQRLAACTAAGELDQRNVAALIQASHRAPCRFMRLIITRRHERDK